MTTAADFGVDLDCVSDLTPEMREVSGIVLFQQAVARRLDCPRGWLIDDPDYGFDLAGRASEAVTTAAKFRLGVDVSSEVGKDARTLTCDVRARFTGPAPRTKATITVDGETTAGPFSMTLAVGDVTVELLEGEA